MVCVRKVRMRVGQGLVLMRVRMAASDGTLCVLVLVVLFWRAKLHEIKPEDSYHTDEAATVASADRAAWAACATTA